MNEGDTVKTTSANFLLTLILCLVCGPVAAHGTQPEKKLDTKMGTELPFLEGTLIEFQSYDPKSRTYKAIAAAFPAEGDSFVTPEGIKKGIHSVDLPRLLRNPTSIVGSQLKTDEKLPTLTEQEVKLRVKMFEKNAGASKTK